jgi:hypothetical protein
METFKEWLDIAINIIVVLMMAACVFMIAELYQRHEAAAKPLMANKEVSYAKVYRIIPQQLCL